MNKIFLEELLDFQLLDKFLNFQKFIQFSLFTSTHISLRCLYKSAKNNYELRRVCPSFRLSFRLSILRSLSLSFHLSVRSPAACNILSPVNAYS
jgi:hypothetical protein